MGSVQFLFSVVLLSFVSFSGTQAFAMGGRKTDVPGYSAKIEFSDDVPEAQVVQMKKDLVALSGLTFKNQDSETLRIMKLSSLDPSALQSWLEDRVQYIIGEQLDLEKALYLVSNYYRYDNPDELPVVEDAPERPSTGDGKKVYTVMSNIGAGIYMALKPKHVLAGLNMDGIGKVAVSSPRVGIIKIGEGHFLPLRRKQGSKETDSLGNSLNRLSTFFHEARHSDGHGRSVGFAHAVCPEGHNFAGYYACDRNLNGPYTVGALMTRAFFESCDACSVEDKEALKLAVADSFSRVLTSTPAPAESDDSRDAKIRLAQLDLEICQMYLSIGRRTAAECKEVENRLEKLRKERNAPPVEVSIPSVDWDDAPEGRR